jgi:hypothetical protein
VSYLRFTTLELIKSNLLRNIREVAENPNLIFPPEKQIPQMQCTYGKNAVHGAVGEVLSS